MTRTYVAVPVAALTDEWCEASTAGSRDAVRITAEGRAILAFRGDVPPGLAAKRYTTRDEEGIRAWVGARPRPATIEEEGAAVDGHRAVLRERLAPAPDKAPPTKRGPVQP